MSKVNVRRAEERESGCPTQLPYLILSATLCLSGKPEFQFEPNCNPYRDANPLLEHQEKIYSTECHEGD